MTEPEKLLRELIALPSVNPTFLPPNDPAAGEGRVADFLAAWAARAGLEVDLQAVQPGRMNLLAVLRARGRVKQRILLAPHLDTVPAASPEQFEPRLTQERIFGRGACDTKGSVAAMLSAVARVAAGGPRPASTEVIFAGLVDEEHAQLGARALAKCGLKARLAIVGEPTELRVVTAHKGSLWLGLETRGRAAHGSRPELGRNAVYEMARVVSMIETVYARLLRRRRHPLPGRATINVGAIAGGAQPNIVPDLCRIRLDRRTLPGETPRAVRAELAALCAAHRFKVRVTDEKPFDSLALETDPTRRLVRRLFQIAGQKKPQGVDYFCDAAVLAAGGVPSVVFGPGDIAQAHTSDEWISRASLASAAAMLEQFIRSLP